MLTPQPFRDLERGLLVGLLAGMLGVLTLASASDLAPYQPWPTLGLVLGAWYGLWCAGLALVYVAIAALALRPANRQRAVSLLALAVLGLSLWHGSGLLRLDGPWRYRALAPASLVLAMLALLALACEPRARRGVSRGLAAASLASFVVAFLPAAEVPHSPPKLEAAGAASPLLLVGIDGADWSLMEPLIARGELPHIASLRERGAWGPLRTLEPTRSPAIWTTVVTGKLPREHGIHGFMDQRLHGVDGVMPPLEPPRLWGFAKLHELLQARGQLYETPVASTSRRVPAYWNVATLHGVPVNVVNWWATWPAEKVLGHVVSELPFYRPREAQPLAGLTYPEALYVEIAPHVVGIEQVGLDDVRRFADVTPAELAVMKGPTSELREVQWLVHFLSLFETTRRLALGVSERGRAGSGPPPDLLALFRLVDMTSHVALRDSELVADHLEAPAEEVRKYGGAVSEAYRATDRALGELIERFPDANVVVVSDHGFRIQQQGGRRFYGHEDAPDGIFLAAGPALRQARLSEIDVRDVFPLLLALKGFPIAGDLAGRVPREALHDAFLAAHPMRRITSYGRRSPSDLRPAAAVVDVEARRRLRALGYIN